MEEDIETTKRSIHRERFWSILIDEHFFWNVLGDIKIIKWNDSVLLAAHKICAKSLLLSFQIKVEVSIHQTFWATQRKFKPRSCLFHVKVERLYLGMLSGMITLKHKWPHRNHWGVSRAFKKTFEGTFECLEQLK